VKAVVLVGGEGTRLRPLTFTTPKPLLPIANEPHLERQLEWLAGHGVDEVMLSMGYRADAFHRHFRHDREGHDVFGNVVLRYAVEDEPLGTAGAIKYAADGINERFVVCNGDVLTDLDLGEMVRFHDERGAVATISLTQVDDPSAFGVVPTNPDGSVIAFVEKPAPGKAPSNWINAGTYVVEPSFLDRIPPRLNVSVERETFPRMLAQPGLLYGFKSDAYWLDIGTPEKYLQAHSDLLDGRIGRAPARDARQLSPGVWVQGSGTIDPAAVLGPPVLVGDGARIEAGARVRRSVVGAGSIVETGAELHGAVLHAGVRVSRGSSVRNSVVGCDAVLSPEVALGADTVVGAGVTVSSGTRISGGRVPGERE
jgi:NDP-sugar pyrophosphorylase family protein